MTQSSTFDTLIYIDITNECNWACDYCNAPYKNSNGDKSKALKISKLFELRNIQYNPDTVKFIITGGEPSIYGKEYNQSIIKAIRCLHKSPVYIEYVSNLSASIDFYNSLDVNSFLFSYHPTQITFDTFIQAFEQITKPSNIRVFHTIQEQFTQYVMNHNPTLLKYLSWYNINAVDGDNLIAEYTAPNIYELTPGALENKT